MPTFALVYHLKGSDQKPQENMEADSITHAGELAAAKFESAGAILCPHDAEMIVVPKDSVAYCHIRAVQQRRTSSVRARNPFEGPEDDDDPVALESPSAE
ncbi:MAG: hypothetical protein H8F28_11235 [Fibrella sp.]|nr:hypothetical protein [Armatimonadota bacterium]